VVVDGVGPAVTAQGQPFGDPTEGLRLGMFVFLRNARFRPEKESVTAPRYGSMLGVKAARLCENTDTVLLALWGSFVLVPCSYWVARVRGTSPPTEGQDAAQGGELPSVPVNPQAKTIRLQVRIIQFLLPRLHDWAKWILIMRCVRVA